MHEGPDTRLRVLAGTREQDEAFAQSWGLTRCSGCALEHRREETWCGSKRPEMFNGLMIVGEGPGHTEARIKEPFVGAAGRILDAMLRDAGIRREETYLANSTLCFPPYTEDDREKKKTLSDATERCNARLRHEIEAVQPRVILALGNYALRAITGRWITKTKRVPLFVDANGGAISCHYCEGERTLPWWKCPECKEPNLLPPGIPLVPETQVPHMHLDPRTGHPLQHPTGICRTCGTVPGASPNHPEPALVQKRKKRCPICEGKKTQPVEIDVLEADYSISKVAGLVFRGRHAPDFWAMEETAKVDLPCAYVIGTWHPSALMRESESKAQKKHGGQFLVNAGLAHFRKALRLLTEDTSWDLDYVVYPYEATREYTPRMHKVALETWFDYFSQIAQATGIPISLDIETDNKDPWSVTDIRCVGFHVINSSPTTGMSRHGPGLVVNTEGQRRGDPIVDAVLAFVETADPKTLQHGIYDKQVMWHIWDGCELDGWVFDTMVAHNAMHPDEPHNLGHIAGAYTDSPPWKPTKKQGGVEIWESREQLWAYNARDIYNTSLATRALQTELDVEDARFVHDLDLAVYHVAADMERAGLPVSPERWEYWRQRSEFYKQRALGLMRHFTGNPEFNPHSHKDVAWALYDPNGPCRLVASHYSLKTGAPSASKEALLTHKGHPFVDLLLDYRRWYGITSNVFNSMDLGADWRLRTRWNVIGARTGRMSTGEGSDKDIDAYGKGNFQNWSGQIALLWWIYKNPQDWERIRDGEMFHEDAERFYLPLFEGDAEAIAETKETKAVVKLSGIRDVVMATPGRKLVGADSSQAELRALAALCGDPTLIEKCKYADERRKLEPEHDPHSYVCSFAFGDAYTSLDIGVWDESAKDGKGGYVGGDPDQRAKRAQLRDLEKRVIYGSFYGAGAETILQSIYDGGWDGPPITREDVEGILAAIWKAFPKVRPWREGVFKDAERTGRIYDPLIRRRREFPLKKVDATVAYNFKLQACIGSLMGMAIVELRSQLPSVDPTAKIIAQIHDAIYIDCAEDKADAVARLLETCMSTELRFVEGAEFMPFPAAAKVAQAWGEL